MLLVALERATHREVDFRQRLLLCRFFRQRAGKITWTEGRLEAMFFPHPELRRVRDAMESIERGGAGGGKGIGADQTRVVLLFKLALL